MDRQSQPILTIKSENGGDGKNDQRKGNKAGENPPVKLENSVILNNLENKLAHLEKPKREEVESLITKYKDLYVKTWNYRTERERMGVTV